MRDALDLLLRLNLAAGAAVLAVMLLRAPARRLFGARIAYGLWSLVPLAALAMLIPTRVVVLQRPSPDMTDIAGPLTPVAATALHAATPPAFTAMSTPVDLTPWIMGLWIAGAAVALLALWRSQARFDRAAREGQAGPAAVGVLRPRIVTPADFETAYSAQERRMILAHEATHLARQDSRINAVAALVRGLNWFNPLIWLMARSLRIDQEFACDATVVARYPRARRIYGEALLKTQLAAHPLPMGCYWPASAAHPLVARVGLLARPRSDTMTRATGLTALTLVALGGASAVWANRPPRLEFSPSHEAVILAHAIQMAPPLREAGTRIAPRPEPTPALQHGLPEPTSAAYYGQAPEMPPELILAAAVPIDAAERMPIPRDERIRGVADLSSVQAGSAVRVLATMVDREGRELTTDLTAFGSQSLYRVGYVERNGSRLKLFTSVIQHGDRFLVTASLNRSFRTEISGTVELGAGQNGTIRLPTGEDVVVHVYPRAETPEETAAAHALRGRHFVNVEQFERLF